MKTTITMRSIANPRRTTLAHLQNADELTSRVAVEESERPERVVLPAQTANPARTVLRDTPAD